VGLPNGAVMQSSSHAPEYMPPLTPPPAPPIPRATPIQARSLNGEVGVYYVHETEYAVLYIYAYSKVGYILFAYGTML
jgi:hypothetical protein